MEEIHWAQKARQLWLVGGDRNTKYFHSVVKKRIISGRIQKIKDNNGDWINDYPEMENFMLQFFKDSYSSCSEPSLDHILNHLHDLNIPTLSDAQRWNLTRGVTEDEIHKALFQMKAFKAPGPDGFPLASSRKIGTSSSMTLSIWFNLSSRVATSLKSSITPSSPLFPNLLCQQS